MMISPKLLCAVTVLLQVADSRSFSRQADVDYEFLVPHITSDFKKDGAPAQWAQGYPKRWGSEEVHFQFNDPEPEKAFSAVVTEDEKYLAMLNGSHVKFIDLDTKAAVCTIDIGAPRNLFLLDLVLLSTPQGGYDLLINGEKGASRYPRAIDDIFHRRLGPDLKPVGELVTYPGGRIGDFDKNGRMATTKGHIYDLNSRNSTRVELKDAPESIVGMSFSGDGQYLSTVGSSADLWNATSGEKIFQFPSERPDTWLTKFSPDSQIVAVASQLSYIQLYSLTNLTAEPKLLGPFQGLITDIAWSPDSKYLAASDNGRAQVWKMPEMELVQTWSTDKDNVAVDGLTWLDDGKKLSFFSDYSRYMYDFGTNAKYWFTQRVTDHAWDWHHGRISLLKKRGLFATEDGDSAMRFWKI